MALKRADWFKENYAVPKSGELVHVSVSEHEVICTSSNALQGECEDIMKKFTEYMLVSL
jgi:hypothetical protein